MYKYVLLCIGLTIPLAAVAKESTVWDFRGRAVAGNWIVTQTAGAEVSEEGLHITSKDGGRMHREAKLSHDADVAIVTFRNALPVRINFGWHPSFAPSDRFVEYPIDVTGAVSPESVVIPLRLFAEWEGRADYIGFSFPANTDFVLESVQFHRYSLLEKFVTGLRSFWVLDNMRNYTINFLWGPLLVFTPDEIPALFLSHPPRAWSALRVFYAILLLAALGALAWWLSSPLRGASRSHAAAQARRSFALTFALLWLLFDLRMGVELLSYVKDDFKSYVLADTGQKTYREFLNFHDIVEQSMPALRERPTYIFLGPSETLFSYLRYETYPSLPALTPEKAREASVMLVFERPDVVVDESSGTVSQNGSVIVSSGAVLKRFGPSSFLYKAP